MDSLGNLEKRDGCTGCEHCSPASETIPGGGLRGGSLVLSAIGLFLFPLAAAITGSILAGPSPVGQFLGALGGLALAGAISVVIGRKFQHTGEGT